MCCLGTSLHAANYNNFKVAVYARAYEVRTMGTDPNYLESTWPKVTNGLKVGKIYLETHRDGIIPDQASLDRIKQFFKSKGVETAAGIATVVNERNNFETFVYTNPEHRKKLQEIMEYTAKNFDEIIIDDFFFTSSKTDSDIAAKGNKSWTRFRLDLMADVAKNVLVGPAKKVNPRVKVVIKYPNWYEHFQYSGYNLEDEPRIFDGLYTGVETRDPVRGNQHLQQYLGYDLFRYFENIAPGRNGGGWVDNGGARYKERYGEEVWTTLFAKAPEMTLFDYRQVQQSIGGAPVAPYAGGVFEQVDQFIGKLGKPVGVKTYKPYHSSGEDFLHDFMGMIGIPMDMTPAFPADAPLVFLTESAKFDPNIVSKIRTHLASGKKVVITSGLLKALQGKGIEDIAELECTGNKALVREFPGGFGGAASPKLDFDIVIPEIRYPTNDSWEVVTTATRGLGYPLLLRTSYSKGTFYVLTIPDNFGDLYNLPPQVLNSIRNTIAGDMFVRLQGPSQVGLFAYDNNKFIVESFAAPGSPEVAASVSTDRKFTKLVDMVSGETLSGQNRMNAMTFDVKLAPASYRVFSAE
ncbi:MAG: hypothetical protein LAQ30_18735 [Acidobacteriia bacterium]|nr:hypothetical protein [Terriglobia bacterium]